MRCSTPFCICSGELCELARTGNVDLLKTYVTCGCPVNAATADGRTCLHMSASVGNINMVECLIQAEAHINAADRWGGTPLRDAVRERHREVALLLHSHGGSLAYDEISVSSQLCESAKDGRLEAIELLLKCGCVVNARDYDARTALHLACSVGNLPAVELLIDWGAEINSKDRWGGTPLRDAVKFGRSEVATFLCGKDAELGYSESEAAGEMCELAKQGSLDLLKVLLDCGSSINAADYDARVSACPDL